MMMTSRKTAANSTIEGKRDGLMPDGKIEKRTTTIILRVQQQQQQQNKQMSGNAFYSSEYNDVATQINKRML
jgi:hypothetical protein